MNFLSVRAFSAAALFAVTALAVGAAQADTLTFDVNDIPSNGPNSAGNVMMTYTLSPYAVITEIDWNVTLTANPKSTLDDMFLGVTGNLGGGVSVEPGYGDSFAGTKSYTGFADLVAQDITFLANANGTLQIEFWDYSNDLRGADGVWDSGTVSIAYSAAPVPEPATGGLMALGLLATVGWQGRRRRNAARGLTAR